MTAGDSAGIADFVLTRSRSADIIKVIKSSEGC